MREFKKFLIIQTAFIGDVILTTPLIKSIKYAYPNSQIDFLTIPVSANLLEKDPNLNELLVFDKNGSDRGIRGFNNLRKKIKSNSYDVCVCPHRSLRSALLAYATGAKTRISFKNSSWKGAFTHTIAYNQSSHETQRNLSLLNILGIDSSDTRPVIYTDEKDEQNVNNILDRLLDKNKKLIAIAPSSVWATKRWPNSHFNSVIHDLELNDFQVLLMGSKQDAELCNKLKNSSMSTVSVAGEFTLRQSKYLLTKCSGLLTNDSAPLHLGLAANIPVFSLFGPTIRQFGFAPIEKNSYIIEIENLECRPCGIHGSFKCPTKTFACMELISPNEVSEKILACVG